MHRDEKYAMLKQISFIDYPKLIGTARYGVMISPTELARRHRNDIGGVPESSFDDLGVYEFFGVLTPHGMLGFRRHTARPEAYSFVSCLLADAADPKQVIAEFCGIPVAEIIAFDSEW